MKTTLILLGLLTIAPAMVAQTYFFDGDLGVAGIQNGSAAWSTNASLPANLRWFKDDTYSAWDNSGLAIAEFGSTSSTSGGTLTLDGEIKVAGMNFTALGAPIGSNAYAFTGGTLNVGTGSIINIANAASGGSLGGQWITFTSLLKGNNLTFQKSGGSTIAFIRFNSANTELTGTLTLKSAVGATSGIYASIGSPTYISSLSSIDVQAGSVYNPTGTGNYAVPVTMSGAGASNYGAIRVDGSNSTFSGALTLSGDARFHTHINTVNTAISGGIGETGGSWTFTRTAATPVNTVLPLATTYSGISNYTGSTILGRLTNIISTTETSGTEGGVNVLDFAALNSPTTNMLYNGTATGALLMIGGLTVPTVLRLNGAANKDNSQSFASTSVQQSATAIQAVSGFNGSMTLNLGAITRTGNGVLAITGPLSGQVTGTVGGVSDGLIGTWATYAGADGKTGGWAGLTAGVVGVFEGDLAYDGVSTVSTQPGYTTGTHLQVAAGAAGAVTFESGVTDVATISMTDSTSARQLDLGGKTLRLGAVGGLQMLQGAQGLTVGAVGDSSVLTAGGANNLAGQILLTNMSTTQPLTVHSAITNNGTGAVSLNVNGNGRTVLTGTNTFTGIVAIQSGVLEVRSSQALGGTGAAAVTKIMAGASLNLSGDITLGETIQANGHGIALDGAIRNLSGVNTITPSVRVQSSTRFTSDAGLLILAGGFTTQSSATGYTFSGNGDFEVRGPITATTGLLTKEGSGTLTLTGASNATGVTTVNNGGLHLNFDGIGAPATNILYSGATLSSTVGSLTLGGGYFRTTGKTDSASSQALGTLTLNSGFSRIGAASTGTGSMDITFGAITRALGGTARFDLPALGAIKTTAGANNALLTSTGGGAYATVGLDDWAATTTAVSTLRNIVGLSSISGYTASSTGTLSGNADIAPGVGTTTLTASTAIGSLRFNQAQATTITQDASGRMLTTGGILVTPAVGANTSAIRTTSLRGAVGSADLVVFQNNTEAPLIISSRILNNAASGTGSAAGLTKAGPGTLILEYDSAYAAGDYTGATRIQNGTLQLVKNTATAISYYLYASTPFIFGSGSTSGKMILGSATTGHAVTQYGGLRTEGTGTANALVGGTANLSTFLHYLSGTFDFRSAFIGGTGTNENNLNLTISLGTLQLGPANTYRGKTTLLQNTIEVTKLADRGLPSSLGTGDFNSTTHIIDMATATTSSQNFNAVATLRYTGSTDSVTNRPLNVSNTDIPGDVVSIVAVLENTGTGTVKFTAPFTAAGTNTVQRVLRLSGTNAGANEIVSFPNVSSSITSKIEKTGTGSWIITGGSTHSGGTSVENGTLLVTNATGSGTGTGPVNVSAGAVLGGTGRIAPAMNEIITFAGGTLQVGTELPGLPAAGAGKLTIHLSGDGLMVMMGGATFAFDLFSGAGQGDNTSLSTSADLAVILGILSMDSDTIVKVSNPTGMTAWAADDQWRLFDWSGLTEPVAGDVTQFDLPTLPAGLVWNTDDLFTTGILSISLVPEPSRALLMLVSVAALALRRRRSGLCQN